MQLVIDDHVLRAHLQGTLPADVAELRAPGEPLWTTRRFQERIRRALERLDDRSGVHRREVPAELRRAVLRRIDGAALLVDPESLASEMAAVEEATGYGVPLWIEALATARLTGGLLVISRSNFSGRMPARFGPASAAVGVEFRVTEL